MTRKYDFYLCYGILYIILIIKYYKIPRNMKMDFLYRNSLSISKIIKIFLLLSFTSSGDDLPDLQRGN